MGAITLNKNNRLFWLGRYAERVYQSVGIVAKMQDMMLDEEDIDIDAFCSKIGIAAIFDSPEDFCKRYPFDRSLQGSIICAADDMLGNGMVLRELLGSLTLSYLQMTVSALELASKSKSCAVELQWVLDDIMAFRGSYAEFVEKTSTRNTIRCGASVERLGTMIRFDATELEIRKECKKLLHRLERSGLDHDAEQLAYITEFISSEEENLNRFELISKVESLFQV
ncbi:alpha-E domain-containing protein [Chakrabartyella piscis]|uniref:alpha-E domain-containing protein n=1 Tax=Chakrabartyella piscis TaxID=2918914 RepID=UPI0029588E3E|nr:alpha-E domain-containing protein [Chakrabartyella piscis]